MALGPTEDYACGVILNTLPSGNTKPSWPEAMRVIVSFRNAQASLAFLQETINPATFVAGFGACSDRGRVKTSYLSI